MKNARYRNYCITTWTKPSLSEVAGKLTYLVYQQEKCPNTEKVHYQGYAEFSDKVSMKYIKELFKDEKMHIECRHGSQAQAIAYCMKKDTKVGDTVIIGKPKMQGGRSDLDSIVEAITEGHTQKEILNEFGGNALRHIHMISKATRIHHGWDDLDALILMDRKTNTENPFYEEPKKCPEVEGNTVPPPLYGINDFDELADTLKGIVDLHQSLECYDGH